MSSESWDQFLSDQPHLFGQARHAGGVAAGPGIDQALGRLLGE
jgi:hypothetical protein